MTIPLGFSSMSLKSDETDQTDAASQTAADAESLRNEEDALLQSLRASREEQDVYEDKVIREATHKLAPALSGLGFPALDSLVHSSTRSSAKHRGADLPPIHKVLSKVRKAQQSTSLKANEADILYFKEQIMLQYMTSVAHIPVDDLPLRRNEEKWLEKRQQREREIMLEDETVSDDGKVVERKKVSFGAGEASTTSSRQSSRQPRVSIMKRKAALKEDNESIPISKADHEESAERKQELKRLRLERQKRKQLRRRAWKESQQDKDSSSEEEHEFGEPPRKKVSHDTDSDRQGESTNQEEMKTELKYEDQLIVEDQSIVICPLCENELPCPIGSDKDEFLSQHMDACQRESRTRRNTRRRTTRNSARTGDDIDDPIEIDSDDQVTANKRTTGKKRKRTVAPAATPEKSPALDDLEEWVYEDRVDDWIENGLERMREMSEIDKTDLPGLEDYGDGLLVPEWINNRLFGYQREGLRVMWECHKQESGLILGDEMVCSVK